MAIKKVIQLEGSSKEGWQQAAQAAVEDASKTLKKLDQIEITNLSANIENGEIKSYNAAIELSFEIEEGLRHQHHH